MPRQRGELKPRYRVPGKGQPAYLTGNEAEAARAADRAAKAARKIRDAPFASPDAAPAKPRKPARPKKAAVPRGPAVVTRPPAAAPASAPSAPPSSPTDPAAAAPAGYVPQTSQQLSAQARAQVAAILNPQTSALNTAYRNQGAGLNAAYGAVAEMQKGVAPAIQVTYDAASARQAVIGKGFSDGFKMASGGAESDLNKILADQGSQQKVTGAGEAGANVLYGLGGALPAGELNAQGAAFASAAQYLPGQARQLGLDSLKASEQARVQALRELQGQRPKLMQDALAGLQGAEAQREALSINRAIAAREGYISDTGQTPEGEWTFDSRMKIIQTTGVDPVTGQRVQKVVSAKAVTPKERRDAIVFANSTAAEAFSGVYDKDGSVVAERVPYQTALFDLMNAGTPLAIAQRALDRFWRKGAKGAQVEMITIGKRRIPFLYFPEWETPGQGRPLVPIQARK